MALAVVAFGSVRLDGGFEADRPVMDAGIQEAKHLRSEGVSFRAQGAF